MIQKLIVILMKSLLISANKNICILYLLSNAIINSFTSDNIYIFILIHTHIYQTHPKHKHAKYYLMWITYKILTLFLIEDVHSKMVIGAENGIGSLSLNSSQILCTIVTNDFRKGMNSSPAMNEAASQTEPSNLCRQLIGNLSTILPKNLLS